MSQLQVFILGVILGGIIVLAVLLLILFILNKLAIITAKEYYENTTSENVLNHTK